MTIDSDADPDHAARQRAFAIAYRMLGSVSDAEDIVQEALLRLHTARVAGQPIDSPVAYLSVIVTRLSIDHLRSARVRREQYVGSWLPEPIVDAPDALAEVEQADSVSMALLVVLESLSPVERAVFLMREVFDYDYADIASVVQKTEANCRQLFVRARQHVDRGRPRFDVSQAARDEIGQRFFAACQTGDIDSLIAVLAEDVVFTGDGGGKALAALHPVVGRSAVVRFLGGIITKAAAMHGRLETRTVNGQPGAVTFDSSGRVVNVFTLDIVDGAVTMIRSVINPDKLHHLGEVSDLALLPRARRDQNSAGDARHPAADA
jgi:RNA polymerase sigma-70 factor, ECF subfamily